MTTVQKQRDSITIENHRQGYTDNKGQKKFELDWP